MTPAQRRLGAFVVARRFGPRHLRPADRWRPDPNHGDAINLAVWPDGGPTGGGAHPVWSVPLRTAGEVVSAAIEGGAA